MRRIPCATLRPVRDACNGISDSSRAPRWVLGCLASCLLALASCHRNIEPFVEGEEPRTPDLSRIFPEAGRSQSESESQSPSPSPSPSRQGAEPAVALAPQRGNVAASPGIRGTIAISPALSDRVPQTGTAGTLFVIARRSGATGGPPLAVLRIPNPRFPAAFEIGQAQVMIPGLVFEGEIEINARLDSDGNAMTKLPGDLTGAASASAPPGTSGVDVILDSLL